MSMWARYETATGKLLHWGTTPFTIAPHASEADVELSDGAILPAERAFVRVVDGALQVDKAALDAAQWVKVRAERTAKLVACDWTQVGDTPITVNKGVWAEYRQALRDVPQVNTDPHNITWPVLPK